MATRNLGQAAIVSKGAYSSGQAYVLLNTVTHRGGSFMCIAPSQGIEPGVSPNWQNYWVATAKGIREISITSDTEGTATITITFSDNTTYSSEYDTAELPDGSVVTGKIYDGAVTAAKLSSGAIPFKASVTIDNSWVGSESPYTHAVSVSGYTLTANSKVDIQPDAEAIAQLLDDEVSALYIGNNNGTLTAYAVGEKPTASLTLQVTVEEVR